MDERTSRRVREAILAPGLMALAVAVLAATAYAGAAANLSNILFAAILVVPATVGIATRGSAPVSHDSRVVRQRATRARELRTIGLATTAVAIPFMLLPTNILGVVLLSVALIVLAASVAQQRSL